MKRKIVLALVCFYLVINSSIQAADPEKTKDDNYSVIWERNLFCLPQKNNKSPKSILKPVITPFNQQIVLKGIITKENLAENLAVIEDLLTHKEDLYKVGEIIRDAQITSISQNEVSFLYHNNIENLSFFESQKFLATVATPSSSIIVGSTSILRESSEPEKVEQPMPEQPFRQMPQRILREERLKEFLKDRSPEEIEKIRKLWEERQAERRKRFSPLLTIH